MKIWQDDSFIFISIRKELYEWSSEGEKKLFLVHFHRFCEPRRQHIISEHVNEENMWGGASAWGVETRQKYSRVFCVTKPWNRNNLQKSRTINFWIWFSYWRGPISTIIRGAYVQKRNGLLNRYFCWHI